MAIDSSTVFPIPTYVVLKDDIISDSLMSQMSTLANLTIIQKPEIVTFKELNVFMN